MDSGKWAILTPILVAVIPVAAGILTAIFNASTPDKAVVTVEKQFIDQLALDSKTGLIYIKNTGGAAATNITNYLKSESKILTAEQSSVVKIILPKFNNSLMASNDPVPINDTLAQFDIPELIQGDGGVVKIKLEFDKPQTLEGFGLIAIYDQGSSVAKTISPFKPNYMWLIWITAFGAEFVLLMYLVIRTRRRKFTKSLLKNLLRIRKKLLTDHANNESFTPDWELEILTRMMQGENNFTKTVSESSNFIKNIRDFIKVDDVFGLISKREKALNSNELKTLNYQLLRSINLLLRNVDWDKYQ